MKNRILFTLSLLLLSLSVFSQEIIFLTGKITDKTTKKPLPFVNVGVTGTFVGVATNIDGFYELRIPSKYKDKELQISCVGYGTLKESISRIATYRIYDVELEPKSFTLSEVSVLGKSRTLYKVVKEAVSSIEERYLQSPFNYDMYYRGELIINNNVERLREAAVRLYDNKGYKRGDAYQVFRERGYDFLEVRKNFKSETLADGGTYIDELLDMDVVRVRGNILNINEIDNYTLKLERESEFEGDKIWIISYKNNNPNLSSTGDYYAKTYSGKLFIKQTDHAIVKNIMNVTANNYSPQGRSFFVSKKRQNFTPKSIKYTVTTTYKSHSGYYYLSYISYNRSNVWTHKTTGKTKKETINAELLVTEVNTVNPQPITSREYYENKPYNEDFWKSYNIIKDK